MSEVRGSNTEVAIEPALHDGPGAEGHPLRDADMIMRDAQRFYTFVVEVVLPFEPPQFRAHSKFHRHLMYTACEPMAATAAPRGFLKSTIFSRYRVLHRLVDPLPIEGLGYDKVDYLLISETEKLSKHHLAWVKHHVKRNPALIERYGDLSPPEGEKELKWNENEIELTNGNRCTALGYGSQIRSRHPTDVTVDDLESKKNMDTPEKLDDLRDWFYRVLMGAMVPETRLTVIGTILEQESLLAELLVSDDFRGRLWRGLNYTKDGEPYSLWEERWPVKMLMWRRKVLGTHRFEAEIQNNPRGLSDPIVADDWIKRFAEEELAGKVPVCRYLTCDPAFTEEHWGCDSAITVWDHMPDGRLYERMAWRGKLTGPALNRMLLAEYYRWREGTPRIKFGVEEFAAQKAIRQAINEMDPEIEVIPLNQKVLDGDKVRRLVNVSRLIENGTVVFKTEALVQEVLNFPKSKKDRVDACVYAWRLYEMDNPVRLDGEAIERPTDHRLSGLEVEATIERMLRGLPVSSHVNTEDVRGYVEAMELTAMIEQMGGQGW